MNEQSTPSVTATTLVQRLGARTARIVVVGRDAGAAELVSAFADAGFAAPTLVPDEGADATALHEADVIILRPPMLQTKVQQPETAPLLDACQLVARHRRRPALVVLESTASVGTTRSLLAPTLEGGQARLGDDLLLVVAPTRTGPAGSDWRLRNTPRVVGGATNDCVAAGVALYQTVVDRVVPVSSLEAAEMTKALETEFRVVNLAMVNELARACHALGLSTSEIIDAASTKPFGYMPFEPGPGLADVNVHPGAIGLTWKNRFLGSHSKLFTVAEEVNRAMPGWIVSRAIDILNDEARAVSAASILVAGVAFKEDVHVVAESPALEIITELRRLGARVEYVDPYVPSLTLPDGVLQASAAEVDAGRFDLLIIATAHRALNLQRLVSSARVVFDLRHATRRLTVPAGARVIDL